MSVNDYEPTQSQKGLAEELTYQEKLEQFYEAATFLHERLATIAEDIRLATQVLFEDLRGVSALVQNCINNFDDETKQELMRLIKKIDNGDTLLCEECNEVQCECKEGSKW